MMGLESLELENYQGPGGGGEDESLETSKATSTEQGLATHQFCVFASLTLTILMPMNMFA